MLKPKYLPSKNTIYQFLFNILLLFTTLLIGNYYISAKLFDINQAKLERKNFIEKQNEFVRGFTVLGQARIYLAENYFYNYINKENDDVLKRSWQQYMGAVQEWNKENLLNPIFIKYYFGEKMQDEFYNDLLPKMVILHKALLKIRDGDKVDNMEGIIEDAKHELFVFSEKLIFGTN